MTPKKAKAPPPLPTLGVPVRPTAEPRMLATADALVAAVTSAVSSPVLVATQPMIDPFRSSWFECTQEIPEGIRHTAYVWAVAWSHGYASGVARMLTNAVANPGPGGAPPPGLVRMEVLWQRFANCLFWLRQTADAFAAGAPFPFTASQGDEYRVQLVRAAAACEWWAQLEASASGAVKLDTDLEQPMRLALQLLDADEDMVPQDAWETAEAALAE